MTTTASPTTTATTTTTTVSLFCDGSCLGNPGPGGWACLMRATTSSGTHEKMLTGGDAQTTNNRMELQAAVKGLEALTRPCAVEVVTDSNYVVEGMKSWIHGWKKNGWKSKDGKPVKNVELWQALAAAAAIHEVRWRWVKGHAGHIENERVDAAARDVAARFAKR